MAQYKTGLATFTNGSSTVTGTGTAWASNLSAGDYIVRRGDALNTYQAYQIGGINSDNSLTLTAPYGGSTASNVEYVAHVDFIDNDRPELSNGDIETAAIMNRWVTSVAQLAQLGTAANLDAQTSTTDSTANRVLKTGAALAALGADVYGKTNAVGTVSQSGGVPTGALVEYVSNANGEYWKYVGGMLVCSGRNDYTADMTAAGGVFVSETFQVTLPAGVITTDGATFSGNDSSSPSLWITGELNSTTNIQVRAYFTSALTGTRSIDWAVIGRWHT